MLKMHQTFRLYLIFSVIFSFFRFGLAAQEITADAGSFGIDDKNKIIVWHHNASDSKATLPKRIKKIRFGTSYKILDKIKSFSYSRSYTIKRRRDTFALYITRLPLIIIDVDTALNKDSKVLGTIDYYSSNKSVQSAVGIEFRGNLSLTYPKKTFDLEFWTDSIAKNPRDIQFMTMRNDDDWILDGLYNEPLRIRSYIASELWNAIHKPHYRALAPEAKSGFTQEYVEVFKNKRYLGLFTLSESVDRKQLDLVKNEDNLIKGELFKAESYEGAPAFEKAPEYNNLFPHWGGFRMEFPVIDYKSHWEDIADLVNMVVNASDAEFTANIGKRLNMTNVIDYFIFVNVLRATDNLGKNYYLARYDVAEPYFFVPWDLDGVMGIIQDGKRIATTDDILSNGLFDRLLRLNPNGYRNNLRLRWQTLRKKELGDATLFGQIEHLFSKLKEDKIYEREHGIWPNQRKLDEDYQYLESWVTKRLLFLDGYFNDL
ncbi:hypothetical protein MTsPCn5_00330 [Croceitalea sp. MTPC5]|nr:hypothetical protein MTsPCn5_00330 [Croceitalea sp. MTPC5]